MNRLNPGIQSHGNTERALENIWPSLLKVFDSVAILKDLLSVPRESCPFVCVVIPLTLLFREPTVCRGTYGLALIAALCGGFQQIAVAAANDSALPLFRVASGENTRHFTVSSKSARGEGLLVLRILWTAGDWIRWSGRHLGSFQSR